MNKVLIIWEERSKPLLAKNMGKNDRHFYGLVVRWQSIPICFSRESSESFLAYESLLERLDTERPKIAYLYPTVEDVPREDIDALSA